MLYLQCLEQRQPLTVCERGKRRLRGRLGLSWMWGSWDEYLKALKDSLLKNRNALGFRNFPVVKKKNPSANAGDAGSILGLRRSLEMEMAIHPSILSWRIPWTEEPGGLESMGSQRVGHERVTEHACFRKLNSESSV